MYKQIQMGRILPNFAASIRFEEKMRGGFLRNFPKSELHLISDVDGLKPGEVSLPVKLEGGWNLFRINDDATALEQIAKEERLQELFREKLAETRAKLYVDVRLE